MNEATAFIQQFGNPDRVVFLTSLDDPACEQLLPYLGDHPLIIRHENDLRYASGRILLSFGTSIIVPEEVLGRFSAAYNIHAASPDYPGRDPHHFAVYDGATRYGATCHIMTKRVDEGPIVDIEWFDILDPCSPAELLRFANEAGIRIIKRIGPRIAKGETLLPSETKWGPRKTTRSDFLAMCHLKSEMSREEIDRRIKAFHSPHHNNLTMDGKPFMSCPSPASGKGGIY